MLGPWGNEVVKNGEQLIGMTSFCEADMWARPVEIGIVDKDVAREDLQVFRVKANSVSRRFTIICKMLDGVKQW
jgi:hypothetical protein